ncbi:hypothetical protein F1721_16995 [Saccharopolyspora hirsuta]|uniref:Uncharacterized protein n=1 Tax=Saccharopolyspora hirsuta TaxID=1837 RepID=A0A5M7BU81_SACHI|nr:hypothetical protein F1721_16995 [Saccharopolyspora hirsuta]
MSVNSENGPPSWGIFAYAPVRPRAARNRSNSGVGSWEPATRISSCHTSWSGSTSATGSPARAPASTISPVVASSTSCPAALAAQISGTTGNVSP